MIVYNITAKVTWSIAEDWLQWEKREHIPEMLGTGLIADYKIFRLLEQDEEEGPTFTMQFFFTSWENYERYTSIFSPSLREKALLLWGNRFIAFRTVMQLVN
ncbi:MAG: DUF4286 family protein [Chitinophagaceae bacterium]|nr:DUF4286 family protein [Chitinophagaceae bacterium]